MPKLGVNGCRSILSTLKTTLGSNQKCITQYSAKFSSNVGPNHSRFRLLPDSRFLVQGLHCGCRSFPEKLLVKTPTISTRYFVSTPEHEKQLPENESQLPKPSLYQRFKTMYKEYWYVLLPVHLVTSAAWFGAFYYSASSGVDIIALLEKLNISEKVINPLRNGHATTGYLAISYALYKIATPLRYTVTLGGTTISINYLKKWGYIKPIPSKEKLKEMYEDKKVILKEKGQTLKDNMMQSLKTSESKKKTP